MCDIHITKDYKMKYFIKANEQGKIFWLTQGDPKSGHNHSWTDNKKNKYILRFNSEEDANHAIVILGYPTKEKGDVYFSYVEPVDYELKTRTSAPYIMIKDVTNNTKEMTLEKFSGMLFKFCFDFSQGSAYANNTNEARVSEISSINSILKYKYDKFFAKLYFRVQVFDANKFLVDIMNGPNESDRVRYRVQFNHWVPVNIENYVDMEFIRRSINA